MVHVTQLSSSPCELPSSMSMVDLEEAATEHTHVNDFEEPSERCPDIGF